VSNEIYGEVFEQIGNGAERAVVRYRVFDHHVEFFAAEVIGWEADDETKILYAVKNAQSLPMDSTQDFNEAERMIEGSVKWDGCSHYYFGDENAYLHICGVDSARFLAGVITTIHLHCGKLLREAGNEILEGEFEK
jgi:hypothetical protein